MAINFPSTPAVGQEYAYSGNTWTWNGRGWVQISKGIVAIAGGGTGANTAAGARTNLSLRELLLNARIYYVRSDGNDSNTGLSNTAGGAFLTIQKAIDTVCSLDVGLAQVTIQIQAGTYAPFVLKEYSGSVPPLIQGDTVTPANVTISATASGENAVRAVDAGGWSIAGLKVQSSSGSGYRIEGRTTLNLNVFNEFGACGSRQLFAYRATIILACNLRVTGGSPVLLEAGYPGGFVSYTGGYTCTFVGSIAFTVAAVSAGLLGMVVVNGITFSGAATGTRYNATTNGVVQTFGSGVNYLPGNAAGTTSVGGIYQ